MSGPPEKRTDIERWLRETPEGQHLLHAMMHREDEPIGIGPECTEYCRKTFPLAVKDP